MNSIFTCLHAYTKQPCHGIVRTPSIIHDVSAGIHDLTFVLPGYKNVTMSVDVPQNGYSTITAITYPGTT